MKAVTKKTSPREDAAGAHPSVEAARHEMPTAASLERDTPREVPTAEEQPPSRAEPPPPGGERADNGSD